MTTAEERVLNACFRLNAEAYEHQVLARGKPLKKFTPCAKAEELMKVIRKDKHLGQAMADAVMEICPCHGAMTYNDLLAYTFDDTYKLANYNHDYKTLYPKLYKQEANQ